MRLGMLADAKLRMLDITDNDFLASSSILYASATNVKMKVSRCGTLL